MQNPECYIGEPHLPHAWRKEALIAGANPEWMSCDGMFEPGTERDKIETAKDKAREVYEAAMCGGTGCCGDIEGALRVMVEELTK